MKTKIVELTVYACNDYGLQIGFTHSTPDNKLHWNTYHWNTQKQVNRIMNLLEKIGYTIHVNPSGIYIEHKVKK